MATPYVTPSITEAPAPTGAPTDDAPPPIAIEYTKKQLAYFKAIVFGTEFGDSDPVIRKWKEDVRIVVHGKPTEKDLATLDKVIADLNGLIDTINVSIVESDGNADIYFAPESKFHAITDNYVPVNMGYFSIWWDGSGNLYRSQILISTTGVTQEERSHLIREELTQSLGLAQDTFDYEDSMFYQGWTTTQRFSTIDEAIIKMLYRPDIVTGMSRKQAVAVLTGT